MLFAWQIQPTVAQPAPRPRDVLVVVDTTASQAGPPLQQARHIITALGRESQHPATASASGRSARPPPPRALTKNFRPAQLR